MPLSKRINNLHINNHQSHGTQQQAHDEDAAMGFQSQPTQMFQQQQQHLNQHNHLNPQPSGSNGPASYMQGQQLETADQQMHMQQHHQQLQQQHLQQQAMLFHQQQSPADSGHSSNHSSNSGSSFDHHPPGGYEPELNNSENPFYYDKNKLLYDLHAERQRRNH